MLFPQLARFTDFGLLLLRLMVGIVFLVEWLEPRHQGRGTQQEHWHEQRFYYLLRIGRIGRSSRCGLRRSNANRGVRAHPDHAGGIQKKIFVWHTDFWGEKPSGWHYDLILVVMNLLTVFTAGGRYVLMR